MAAPGDRIERYEVVRLLGEGGMARVYLARHTALDTLHAIKILMLTGPTLSDRLSAEGRAQAQLRDDHIVRVSDVLLVDGLPALVMDFVDGPDLHRWIREVRPAPALAEEVFRGIVAGVAAAHAHGIVHRDLKPANVLMARDGQGRWVPKVGDFGLVKVVQGDEQAWKTRSGLPMGTPAYMAPEQIRNAAGVDARADLWSLGCILHELLAHHVAFDGTDLMDIFDRIGRGRREPLPAAVPARLRAVVDACLAPEPDRRPADCAALLALLDGVVGPTAPTRPDALPPDREAIAPAVPSWVLPVVAVASGGGAMLLAATVGLAVSWVAMRADPTAPCDPSAAALGYARIQSGPLGKKAGGVWLVRADTPVVLEVPQQGVLGTQVCMLPAGTRYTLPADPDDGWVPVLGSGIALPEVGAELPPEDDEEGPEVASGACAGPPGERIGWFFTKPLPLAGAPAPGKRWTVSSAKQVYAEPSSEAAVVCRIPAGTSVPVVEAPVREGRGFWVPLVPER